MPDSAPEASRGTAQLDAIVIGAGVSGLYALHRLRDKMGMKVRVFERADGVGGTWYWNRYPGCRCDVESLEYSYSFDPDLEQEWHWPERYGNQYEILTYVEHVAKRFDLYKDIQFETRVTAAHYDRAIAVDERECYAFFHKAKALEQAKKLYPHTTLIVGEH